MPPRSPLRLGLPRSTLGGSRCAAARTVFSQSVSGSRRSPGSVLLGSAPAMHALVAAPAPVGVPARSFGPVPWPGPTAPSRLPCGSAPPGMPGIAERSGGGGIGTAVVDPVAAASVGGRLGAQTALHTARQAVGRAVLDPFGRAPCCPSGDPSCRRCRPSAWAGSRGRACRSCDPDRRDHGYRRTRLPSPCPTPPCGRLSRGGSPAFSLSWPPPPVLRPSWPRPPAPGCGPVAGLLLPPCCFCFWSPRRRPAPAPPPPKTLS